MVVWKARLCAYFKILKLTYLNFMALKVLIFYIMQKNKTNILQILWIAN